ncbi:MULTISPECIES: hypothetical protein [Clostridium]|uniref:Alpha/beta hydrolase family protein n=1 Tax=Clostridium frigoriphilum TaxID=443253 RepID=A0ABU7UPL2_9CLOT|nr:hypothetical protein [Clostridium sp. DSM 17811]MBU3100269.1 hypothetical protein [Clostridium sp. DSM 17811]
MKFFIYTGLIIIVLPIIALLYPTWTSDIKGENSISVLEQVKINGSNHEIMIRGNDRNNPVVIFVHGGPGCPEIASLILDTSLNLDMISPTSLVPKKLIVLML